MIEFFSHSEPGGHARNEDAFEVRRLSPGSEGYLGVLADGWGGQPGGGEAARMACHVGADAAARLGPASLLLQAARISMLDAADWAVADDPKAGYTTVIALAVTESYLCGASCGDSAAVLFQGDGTMTNLTARQQKNPPVGSGFATFTGFAANLIRPWMVLVM